MTEMEGGLPGDLPAVPRDSVEAAQRKYQLADRAYRLGIPPEHLRHSTVRRFVSVVHDTEVLRDWVGAPAWQQHLPVPAALSERLDCAFYLLTVSRLLLQEGLTSRRLDLAELSEQVSQAGQYYGWLVMPIDWTTPLPAVPAPTGLWRRAPTEPGWPPAPPAGISVTDDEPTEPVVRSRLAAEAERRGVPPGLLAADPTLRQMLAVLVAATNLRTQTEDTTDLPAAPGLTPTGPQRLARVHPLNRLVVAVLDEEFQPGQLTAERFAATLAPVTRAYRLQISRRGGEPGALSRLR